MKKPIDLEKEFKTLKQGKRHKMSDKRRKALSHARGIIKRLEKAGYEVNFGDLAQKSTRKLQNVSRKSLIQSGAARWRDNGDGGLEPPGKDKDKGGIGLVPEWRLELGKIRRILQEGSSYYGEHSKKGTSAYTEVNISADSLTAIIDDAVDRLGGREVVRRIKEYWKDLTRFEELLNKLITAVYDDVYSVWGSGGRSAYERDVENIRRVLGVDDGVGEIIYGDDDF